MFLSSASNFSSYTPALAFESPLETNLEIWTILNGINSKTEREQARITVKFSVLILSDCELVLVQELGKNAAT